MPRHHTFWLALFALALTAFLVGLFAGSASAHYTLTRAEVHSPAKLPPQMHKRARPVARASHFIPKADAQSRWYYVFNSHCGNGDLWVCRVRNLYGIDAIRAGEHSYYLWYDFREEYVPTGNQRTCEVTGRLYHSTVANWSESCSG